MKSSPLRWGIIGCGDVCEVKSGPPLYKIEHSTLHAVMRRDRGRAEDFARRHGVPLVFGSASQLIEHPEVDVVYIATPPGTHCQYAVEVAAAGKPCYVEKPMARNATECRQMVEVFERAKLPLFVAYYRRALPRFAEVRRLLESGQLGRLRSVHHSFQGRAAQGGQPFAGPSGIGWRERCEQSGGGLFVDLGSHVLDLIDHLLGPLSQVRGHAFCSRVNGGSTVAATPPGAEAVVEDTVVGTFVVNETMLGSVRHQYHTAEACDLLQITGSEGSVQCSVFGAEDIELRTAQGLERFAVEMPEHVQQPLQQTIVSQLLGQGGECPSTGQSAMRTSVAMDQILAPYYGGRRDPFWQRPAAWPGASAGHLSLRS